MPVVNADVVAVFNEIADLLEVKGANVFRVRAYRNAARVLGGLRCNVKTMLENGEDLDALPGIGFDLAGKIAEVVNTGSCTLLNRLHAELPPAMGLLLKIPGMGPKRVQALHHDLGIQTLDDAHRAAEQDRVCKVHGFGKKLQQQILQGTATQLSAQDTRRFPRAMAVQVANALMSEFTQVHGVRQAVIAGSLRRMRETVGDVDLLVSSTRANIVMERFTANPEISKVLARGTTRSSIVLRNGLQIDLRAVEPASFAAAWLYFTGSKEHNIALRKLAQDAGLKLNEYGLYRGKKNLSDQTEASIYQELGLSYIEPELRENRGEIEAAQRHQLPALLQVNDLRGDLHAHTNASDGHDSLQAMAEAARAQGLKYLAITEHSQHLGIAHGLDEGRLARQIDTIDELNASLHGITLLKGVEVDIMEDGSLDLPDSLLGRLDLVVGAVHHRFDLPRERQTERILRAMDHRHFSILAHPTNRLIDERPACDIDLPRVIQKARERGCFLELNAHPARLDLDDIACRAAKDAGVLVSVNSDAHSTLEFDNLHFGVSQARRGWLGAQDVLNTRTLDTLRPLLNRTMGHNRCTGNSMPDARGALAHASAD